MRPWIAPFLALFFGPASIRGQVVDIVGLPLQSAQYDLSTDGRAFLLAEAKDASFFLLGELHGENEIPALIREIWPSMWELGYRRVAAELSPWTADQLEFGSEDLAIAALWTRSEARFVAGLKRDETAVLWGCDIEEGQPHLLLRELAAANPADPHLRAAVEEVRDGYQRRAAPKLLELVRTAASANDPWIHGVSLRGSLLKTLEVESNRLAGATLEASLGREAVMKGLFHQYWLAAGKPKVFLRFGRNHLHRGYDRRGVSTLGNFVAELATAERLRAFNVAAFSGGGKVAIAGPPVDFDERPDDPAFAYLASIARYPATVFDLRPSRQALHRLPSSQRSPTERSLLYWADSYDAILFYREVTPLGN
jgi:hypothetical protein